MIIVEDVSNVPVWLKLHGVSVVVFIEDGFSVIATKLDTSLIINSYTSNMCIQSWGRSSYARALIKIQANACGVERYYRGGDEGKPLEKVDSASDHDSDDEVESLDNKMTSFPASKKVGYGTNSLLEQLKKTYENADYDYDPYDDDLYKG
ncbi:hypothetical protein Tco_0336243 [Tanacetum coccineum]